MGKKIRAITCGCVDLKRIGLVLLPKCFGDEMKKAGFGKGTAKDWTKLLRPITVQVNI